MLTQHEFAVAVTHADVANRLFQLHTIGTEPHLCCLSKCLTISCVFYSGPRLEFEIRIF